MTFPIEAWQHERARIILGDSYEIAVAHGLTTVPAEAGLPTSAPVRERLISLAEERGLQDSDFADAPLAQRLDAAGARSAEFVWLCEHLRLPASVAADELDPQARRSALLSLWF